MRRPPWRWLAALAGLVLAVAAIGFLPVAQWLEALEGWIDGRGALGVLVFALAYFAGTVLLLPEWMFTVAAGAIFGMGWGLVMTMTAAMSGAVAAFLLARYALRERVEKRLLRNPVLAAANKALRKEGWKVVALVRLSPLVPFGVQNYFFGVTKVKLVHYVLASAVAILPGSLVYLFLGATGRTALRGGGPMSWALIAGAIVVSIVIAWLVTRVLRRKLGLHG